MTNEKPKSLSDLTAEEENILVEQAKTDTSKMEQVIAGLTNVMAIISKPYNRQGIDLRDLYQQSVLGIHRAVAGFDPSRGYRFSTYARWWILSCMQTFYLGNTRAFTIPASESGKLNDIAAEENRLEELGLPIDDVGIANACNISGRNLEIARRCINYPESLHNHNGVRRGPQALILMSEADNLGDILPDNERDNPDERYARVDMIDRTRYAISCLSDIEKAVISMRWGLNGSEEKTLTQTGQAVNLSYERVRQIEIAGMRKIRSIVTT